MAAETQDVIMEWLMEDAIHADAGLSLARMTVATGATSELHRHSNCSETIHVLSGEVEQRIGDEWQKLYANDTCLIPTGVKHQTKNLGEKPAIMMLAYSAGRRIYVSEN